MIADFDSVTVFDFYTKMRTDKLIKLANYKTWTKMLDLFDNLRNKSKFAKEK